MTGPRAGRRLGQAIGEPSARLLALVIAVGMSGGAVGAAYVALLKLVERGLWPTHWSNAAHLGILAAVGATVGLLLWWLGSPGDVELLVDNIHVAGGTEDLRDMRSLIPISLLCVGAGGAMGPEAPLVQTTGSIGSWLARRWRVSVTDVRILTITGMAAGFTVLFGAPIGSAVFALEILHRRGLEYYEAFLPAVVGALSGFVVNLIVTRAGITPVWKFPPVGALPATALAWGAACGVAGAVVAAGFTYLTRGVRWCVGFVPANVRPLLGGISLGLLALWSPYALTFGEAQISTVLVTRGAATTFLVAMLAKLCGTTVTLTSGWRGGFIIPLFFMGVSLGRFGHALLPHSNGVLLMVALMAAVNVGVTKTPVGSALVVCEMAGLRLLPPVFLASVVALFLTSNVGLLHSQRARSRPVDAVPASPSPG